MTRFALFVSIFAVLLAAFLLGWLLHWLWARMHHHRSGAADPLHEMAERLHDAEIARDAAERKAIDAEATARSAIAEREAELGAAMDTIGALRHELGRWQSAYESLRGGGRSEAPEAQEHWPEDESESREAPADHWPEDEGAPPEGKSG